MIDLHTHTVFSDGALIPAELVRRARVKGYEAIGLTDHGDASNLDLIIPRVAKVAKELSAHWDIRVIPGIELTHNPPPAIAELTAQARALGARLVVVHGETLVEPVLPGTNRAAIEAGVDILAHPGLITAEEVALARAQGVCLEISSRRGHCLGNGHVARLARQLGAALVLNTDTHDPGDLIDDGMARRVLLAAGLDEDEAEQALANARRLVEQAVA